MPSTVISTAFPSEQYKDGVKEGYPFLEGLGDLHDVTWVDLPTSHWPMWSRPRDVARILAEIAEGGSPSG